MEDASRHCDSMEVCPDESGGALPCADREASAVAPVPAASPPKRKLDEAGVSIAKQENTSPWTYEDFKYELEYILSTNNASNTSRCPVSSSWDCDADRSAVGFVDQQSTPTRGTSITRSSKVKPGSDPVQEPHSPECNDHDRRKSVAKKRLFTEVQMPVITPGSNPLAFFWEQDEIYNEVLSRVFQALQDKDLYACYRVCKNWREVLLKDEKVKDRIFTYISSWVMDKENRCEGSYQDFKASPVSSPKAPKSIYEITNVMSEHQTLEKCLRCGKASSIIDRNISQCTSYNCGFIRCIDCTSCSEKGPENFEDRCRQSDLVIKRPRTKFSVMTSPKPSDSGIPTFLADTSAASSSSPDRSSGYVTDADRSADAWTSFGSSGKGTSSDAERSFGKELTLFFRESDAKRLGMRSFEKSYGIATVVPLECGAKGVVEAREPPSPPRIDYVPCSKRSKKMLRRTLF